MGTIKAGMAIAAGLFLVSMSAFPVIAADTEDGISEATDEPVAADDNIGNKDTNINFVVTDAVSQAKVMQKKQDDTDKDLDKNESNLNDGEKDNNQNSIVLAPGSHADKVYNIVIQK